MMHDKWQTTSKNRWWRACLVATLIWTLVFPPALFTPENVWAAFVDAPDSQFSKTVDTSYAVATADVDGDGNTDVVVANAGQSRLLLGDGLGSFTDVTDVQFPVLSLTSMTAALGDVDGDQDADLVLGDVHGPNRLLLNDGNGQFALAPAANLPAKPQASVGMALGDVDRDGDLDLVVANRRSQNRLWLNDGNGTFTDATDRHLPSGATDSYDVVLGDVDGNGTLDLVVANHRDPDQLLLNDGLGVFSDVTASQLAGDSGDSFDADLADVDTDGDLDLVIAAGVSPVRLWTNNGQGVFSDVTGTHLPTPTAFGVRIDLGDVDNDGHIDMVVGTAGQDRVWLGDGSGQFTDATDTLMPVDTRRSFGLALLDADHDLDPDLLVASPEGANRLLVNVLPAPRLRVAVTPPAPRELGNPITLTIQAADEDGLDSATLSLTDPAGQTQDIALLPDLADGEASHTFIPTLTGDYQASIVARDPLGNTASRQVAIPVLAPDVTAPQVTVAVTTSAPIIEGQTVSLQVTATDDRGVVQTSLLINSAPVPVASDGRATFVTTSAGPHTVVAQASDAAGNTGQDSTTFTVDADTTPPSIAVTAIPDPVALTEPIAITVAATDDVAVVARTLSVSGPAIPSGLDLTLDAQGQATFTPFQPGAYTLDATATDPSGNTNTATTTFTATGTPDTTPPTVQIQVTPNPVGLGTPVTVTVTTSDDSPIASTTLIINDILIPLDTSGQAIYSPPALGTYNVSAVARDAFGNVGNGAATFDTVEPDTDTEHPVVDILSPANGSELTAPVDIIGTVQDQTLVRYTLSYAPHGETNFTSFAEGHVNVTAGVLGTLDTSLLLNDIYDIRLTAEDSQGRIVSLTTVYQVAGGLKVGHFNITVRDLKIEVAGLPIEISRTYDSRDKGQGDFGIGWRLGVQSTKIRENQTLGQNWEQTRTDIGLISYYCIEPVGDHFVAVTLPDGQVETFDFLPMTPESARTSETFGDLPVNCQFVSPISAATTTFIPRLGTYSSLVALGDDSLLTTPQEGPVELFDADVNAYDPAEYQLTQPDGTVFELDQNFGVRSMTDPNGNTLTFNDNGIIHSAGQSITFSRDAEGRIVQIVDPLGETIQYDYDAAGDLVQVTDREGGLINYAYDDNHLLLNSEQAGNVMSRNEYDASGRLLTTTNASGVNLGFTHDVGLRREVITDESGNPSTVEFDDRGNILRVIDPIGNITTHTYDAEGNQTSTTNALGHTTTRTFDTRGNQLTETNPLGQTITRTYDDANRILTQTDPLGRVTTLTYDSAGNLLTKTNALGITEKIYTYDAQGNRLTNADAIGRTYTYEHDSNGYVTRITDPDSGVETFEYDQNGNLIRDTDERGNLIITRYNANGLFTEKEDEDGNITRFGYDALGQMTSITGPNGNRAERVLDFRGNESQSTNPLGHTVTRVYNGSDQLLRETDARGNITTYEYDAAGQRTKAVFADGSSAAFAYDGIGQEISRTDTNGNEWERAYDAAGRNTEIVDPLGHLITRTYDAAGNLIEETDGLGRTTTIMYDAANRPITTTYPDGTTTSLTYDMAGRVDSRTDELGQVTLFQYDSNDQITQVTDPMGQVTTATYDGTGKRLSLTNANSQTTQFEYDNLGRLTRTTVPGGLEEIRTYDAFGNLAALTAPNGDVTGTIYDAQQQLIARTHPDGSRVDFTYNPDGLLESATNSQGATQYVYDNRNRVSRIDHANGSSLQYTYDAMGNQTSVTSQNSAASAPQTTTYAYNALNQLVSVTNASGGVTLYAYDAVGNRIQTTYPNGATTAYSYDDRDRVTMIEHRQGSTVNERFEYAYNAVGDRIREDHLDGASVDYAYDMLRRLVQETHRDGQGTWFTI